MKKLKITLIILLSILLVTLTGCKRIDNQYELEYENLELYLNIEMLDNIEGWHNEFVLSDIVSGIEGTISLEALDRVFGMEGWQYSHQNHDGDWREMQFDDYIVYHLDEVVVWIHLGLDTDWRARPNNIVRIIEQSYI